MFTVDQLDVLRKMEGTKDLVLSQEEQKWMLKSRALWLKEGFRTQSYFIDIPPRGRALIQSMKSGQTRGQGPGPFQKKTKQ